MPTEDKTKHLTEPEMGNRSTDDAELFEAGEMAEERQVEMLVTDVEQRSDELIREIDTAISSVTTEDESLAVDEMRVELDELRNEAEKVKKSFKERIRNWLVERRQDRQEKRQAQRERDLNIADNPKIIKDLERRLERVRKRAHSLREKETRAIKKKSDKWPSFEDQTKIYNQVVLSQEDDLVTLVNDYHMATKEDSEKWSEVDSKVDSLLSAAVRAAVADGDFEKGIKLLGNMSDRGSSYDLSVLLFEQFLTSKDIQEGYISSPASSAGKLKARFSQLIEAENKLREMLQGQTEILERFDGHFKYWSRRVISEGEDFLRGYDDEVLDNFYQLDEETRAVIIQEVSDWETKKYKRDMWGRVLGWKERSAALAKLMVDLKNRLGDYPSFEEKDRVFVESIFSIEETRREEVMSKVGPLLKNTKDVDWALINGYTLAGTSEDVGIEDLKKLPPERIKVLASLPIIFGADRIKEMLSKEELEKWAQYEGFPNRWRSVYWDEKDKLDGATAKRLVEFCRDAQGAVLEHAQALRPIGRNAVNVDAEPAIADFVYELGRMEYVASAVSEKYREKFFSSLKISSPGAYPDPHKLRDAFESGKVANYWEYLELVGEEEKFTISDFVQNESSFEEEHWFVLRKGIQTLQQEIRNGAISPSVISRKNSRLFEMAGLDIPESAKANALLKYFCEGGEMVVFKKRKRMPEDPLYESKKRAQTGDAVSLYDFVALMEKYFQEDQDLMLSIFSNMYSLDELEKKSIQAYLDGKFISGQAHHMDDPVLEGCMYDIVERGGGYGHEPRIFKGLDEVVGLSREEKILFLEYYKFFGACEVEIVHDERAVGIMEMIKKFSDQKFSFDMYKKMAERPECVGLYYYLPSFSINRNCPQVVDRLIELYDAGLDSGFFASDQVNAGAQGRLSEYVVENLLKCEPTAIVYVANLLAQYNPGVGLHDAMYMISSSHKKTLAEVEQAKDRFIKQAHIGEFAGTTHYLFMMDDEEIERYDLDFVKENVRRAEELLGRELDKEEKEAFTDKFVYRSDLLIVEKLLSDKGILALFLQGARSTYGLSGIEGVDDTYLHNPVFWQYLPSSETMKDGNLLETHMKIASIFAVFGLRVDTSARADWWNRIYEVYEKAPVVFDSQFLSAFAGQKMPAYELVDLANRVVAREGVDEAHLGQAQRLLSCFEYAGGSGSKKLFDQMFGVEEEVITMIEKAQGIVGERLPAGTIDYFVRAFQAGRNAEEVVADLDRILNEPEAVSRDFEQSTGIDSYNAFENWWRARNGGLLKRVENNIPVTISKILGPLLVDRGMGGEARFSSEYFGVCQRLLSEDPEMFKNLERISMVFDGPLSGYNRNNIENLFFIAKSPNFKHVMTVLDSERIKDILYGEPSKIAHLCSLIDAHLADQIINMPEYIIFTLEDIPTYFTSAQFKDMLAMAQEMRAMFADEFKVSIRQLALMDLDKDRAFLRRAGANCAAGSLDTALLQRLSLLSQEEDAYSASKLLVALKDRNVRLPVSRVLDDLEGTTAEFAKDTIMDNYNYLDWELMDHKEKLIVNFGFSDKDVKKLVGHFLRWCPLPLRISHELLMDILGAWDNDLEQHRNLKGDIFKRYEGGIADLSGVLTEYPDFLQNLRYDVFPKVIQESEVFLRWFALHNPKEFVNIPETDRLTPIVDSEVTMVLIKAGCVREAQRIAPDVYDEVLQEQKTIATNGELRYSERKPAIELLAGMAMTDFALNQELSGVVYARGTKKGKADSRTGMDKSQEAAFLALRKMDNPESNNALFTLASNEDVPSAVRRSTLRVLSKEGRNFRTAELRGWLREWGKNKKVSECDWRDLGFVRATLAIPSAVVRKEAADRLHRGLGLLSERAQKEEKSVYEVWETSYKHIPQETFVILYDLTQGDNELLFKFGKLFHSVRKESTLKDDLLVVLTGLFKLGEENIKTVFEKLKDTSFSTVDDAHTLVDVLRQTKTFHMLSPIFNKLRVVEETGADAVSIGDTPNSIGKFFSKEEDETLQVVGEKIRDVVAEMVKELLPHEDISTKRFEDVETSWGGDLTPIFTYLGRFPDLRLYIGELVAHFDTVDRWKEYRYDLKNPVTAGQIGHLSPEHADVWQGNYAAEMGDLTLAESGTDKGSHIRSLLKDAIVSHRHVEDHPLIQTRLEDTYIQSEEDPEHRSQIITSSVDSIGSDIGFVDSAIQISQLSKLEQALDSVFPSGGIVDLKAKTKNQVNFVATFLSAEDARHMRDAYKEAERQGAKTTKTETIITPEMRQAIQEKVEEIKAKFATMETDKELQQRLGLEEGTIGNVGMMYKKRQELTVMRDILRLSQLSNRLIATNKIEEADEVKGGQSITSVIDNLKKFFEGSALLQDIENVEYAVKEREQLGGEKRRLAMMFTDNPQVMWQVGKYPLGCGSCQNYETGSVARALLGYVGDAHIKTSYLFDINQLPKEWIDRIDEEGIAAVMESIPPQYVLEATVARSITKLAQIEDGSSAIFLEPTYSRINKSDTAMDKYFAMFVGMFVGSPMGARLARGAGEERIKIPKTKNPGGQYEDGALGAANHGGMGTQSSEYAMGVKFVEEAHTPTKEESEVLERMRTSSGYIAPERGYAAA